eukprot:5009091-Lingulodinium_polyedra.AAC.1
MRHHLDETNVLVGRLRNTRIRVRVQGGRDCCFELMQELRRQIAAHEVKERGRRVTVRVEDDPIRAQQKGSLTR